LGIRGQAREFGFGKKGKGLEGIPIRGRVEKVPGDPKKNYQKKGGRLGGELGRTEPHMGGTGREAGTFRVRHEGGNRGNCLTSVVRVE